MNKDTIITITEIKNGQTTGKSYDITVGKYINIVWQQDSAAELNISEPIEFDEDGDVVEWEEKFWSLPVEEQLARRISLEEEKYAATITFKEVA